jgi:hypothetical protein
MRCGFIVGCAFCAVSWLSNGLTANAQNYAQAGALQRNGAWEVGVTFSDEVDLASVPDVSHYALSSGEIMELRFVPQDRAVVLVPATALAASQQYTLHITNIISTNQTVLPPVDLGFRTGPLAWTEIGANELGFPADAAGVGEDGFDLISGGVQFWSTYDEGTFVYEKLSGDFDKKVRVAFQDSTSAFAKAGLMAREFLDEGKPRADDPNDPAKAFSRYVMVDVNPVTTAEGADANNLYEVLVRPFPGGIGSPNDPTESLDVSQNAAPPYPQAWLRLKREGQTFSFFRGSDGVNWTLLTAFTFPTQDVNGNPAEPFPNEAYVGGLYSPENGNISLQSGLRNSFVAHFRDYGVASGTVDRPKLTIVKNGTQVKISWVGGGTLQGTRSLATPAWGDIPGASNPYLTTPSGNMFFRVKL